MVYSSERLTIVQTDTDSICSHALAHSRIEMRRRFVARLADTVHDTILPDLTGVARTLLNRSNEWCACPLVRLSWSLSS